MKCINKSHPKFFSLLADVIEIMKEKGIVISDQQAFMNTVEAIEIKDKQLIMHFEQGTEISEMIPDDDGRVNVELTGASK